MKLHSLTFKIPLIMGLSITLSIFVITFIMFLISLKSVDIVAQNGFETTAIAYESTANLWIEHQKTILDGFATNANIINYLLQPNEENFILSETALVSFKNSRPASSHFTLLNKDGNVLADSENGALKNYNNGIDPHFYFYSDNLKNNKMCIVKSAITGEAVYKMYTDIKDYNGNIIGVLSSHIDWSDFIYHCISFAKVGETGKIMIIDEDKNIIADKDGSRILTKLENFKGIDELNTSGEFINHYKYNDKLYMMYLNPIIYPHWYILVTIEEDELYNPVRFMLTLPIFVGIILAIVSVIIIWSFLKYILSPINEAVKEAENIANGDLTSIISEKHLI